MFITFSLYPQRHDHQIPTLHDEIDNFMRELACKFVEIDAVYKADEIGCGQCGNIERKLKFKLFCLTKTG